MKGTCLDWQLPWTTHSARSAGVPLGPRSTLSDWPQSNATLTLLLCGALSHCRFGSVVGCESFHADLHAGNLLVLPDGRVGFIDFGG